MESLFCRSLGERLQDDMMGSWDGVDSNPLLKKFLGSFSPQVKMIVRQEMSEIRIGHILYAFKSKGFHITRDKFENYFLTAKAL